MRVFFYGLFMDEAVLAAKHVRPSCSAKAHVDGFALVIGERATLRPAANSRAYGLLMTLTAKDVATLYSEPSVVDYVAETIVVTLPGGKSESAVCYNLPAAKVTGTNPEYASALLALATELGFPATYLEEIGTAAASANPGR